MERIEGIKRKFKNEWVLVEILEEDKKGEPTEVKLITHSKNRNDTYKAMGKTAGKYVYHFWTGEIPAKGYAVAFGGLL